MSRIGPLRGREFRLLFAGRTISVAGSAMAPVALAFGVLDTLHGTGTQLGLVLAARSLPTVVFVLFGGVLADRLPRHRVMVSSNVASAASQAAVAVLLLSGSAHIWELAALGAVNGTSTAFFFPASAGIIPQIVEPELLQEANALLRLGLNATNIGGAAIGGLLVAATSPGWAIAFDAATFAASAVLVGAMRVDLARRELGSAIEELREGWHDFWSRQWLWAIVIQFGIVNAVFFAALQIFGPLVTKQHFGGAAAWGGILAATSAGLICSGFVMLRYKPRRLLLVATIAVFPFAFPLLALAGPAPLAVIVVAAFAAGFSQEIFGVCWVTTIQQQIPQEKLSRLSAYDALGSWALMPLGLAILGPISAVAGTRPTLIGCAIVSIVVTAAVLLSNDVRTLERV